MATAQTRTNESRSEIFGLWRLNRESSTLTPSLSERGDGSDRARGGPPPQGGFSGGGRPGGGMPRGGFGGRGTDPEAVQQAMAPMRELMTPSDRLIISRSSDEAIVFVEADGRTTRITPNDKKEKHQLTAGIIETRTKWSDPRLRQDISLPGGVKMLRTFEIEPETTRLLVTTTFEGGQRPPIRFVYDSDADK